MPTPFTEKRHGRFTEKSYGRKHHGSYGRCRQSLWALQTIVMGVADMGGAVERYGQAYGTPFVTKILVLQP